MDAGKVVLHWFSGSAAEAARASSLGCYFSINQAMFRSERGLAVIKTLPIDRLLTETDGPFVEVDSNPIRPGDVAEAIRLLAMARGYDADSMRKQVVINFVALVAQR